VAEIKRPSNIHAKYHAHVYFDSTTVQLAKDLCQQVGELFNLKIGRIHTKPIGPHPLSSCQISFTNEDFDQLIPWLNNNRKKLVVLVHAQTGNDLKDHTDYAYWLGEGQRVQLNLAIFNNS
jgi:DOPA 4,5-dioxygenase